MKSFTISNRNEVIKETFGELSTCDNLYSESFFEKIPLLYTRSMQFEVLHQRSFLEKKKKKKIQYRIKADINLGHYRSF